MSVVTAGVGGAPPAAAALPAVAGSGWRAVLADGSPAQVVQLNNAATTPPFVATLDAVAGFLGRYGALHRGAGPRARATCDAVADAIAAIREFIGCPRDNELLFTSNTSTAINLLARLLDLAADEVVLTSLVEHTSNNLPWRYNSAADVGYVLADDTGALDYSDLARQLSKHKGNVRLLAVTGASNLTGFVADLPRLADLAHRADALLFVDAAQLAPHRPIDMAADGVDALAFSAHKLYAPFGIGVLSLPARLTDRRPVDPGGGSIDMLDSNGLVWAPPDQRHQVGTWNGTGVVAAGASCRAILACGWPRLLDHERELVEYTAARLATVRELTLFVPPERYRADGRIGTFPFSLAGMHHALVAAILEYEYGIEVRAGTICNHRLVRRWFGISDKAQADIARRISAGDRLASYGVVRVSLGLHNTVDDVDAVVEALDRIATSGPTLAYRRVPSDETFEAAID
jgi:selenocysteine lyase/cysteine desulfurase